MLCGGNRGIIESWMDEGQNKWMEERVTAITLEECRLVAVHQPVYQQGATMKEEYRH